MNVSFKKISLFMATLFITTSLSALEVDVDEIKLSSPESFEFENYGGPHAVIESAASITGIGTALGTELSQDIITSRTIQPEAKYSVIHSVNSEADALNADIFIIGETAGVDHIANLRRILTGFLMAAYNYNLEDAQTVATFITVYNAVYRNDMDSFSAKYNQDVLNNLIPEKAGLSKNWEEWAGGTQIVIPLKNDTQDSPAIETSTISDEKVIEAMRNEPDKAIEEREKMTEIKEREITEATKNAQQAQKDAAQQKKDGDIQAAKQSSQTSKEQQQIADKKRTEVQTEKQNIAKDKEELLALPTVEYETGLFGAYKKGLFSIMNVNAQNGEITKKTSSNIVRSNNMYMVQSISIVQDGKTTEYPQMFIAICGENSGKSAVRLCLIDTESLEIKAESTETLSDTSDFITYNENFLVVLREKKKNYAALYDKNLKLLGRSSIEVNPASPLNVTAHGLLVTTSKGQPALLSLTDLSQIW